MKTEKVYEVIGKMENAALAKDAFRCVKTEGVAEGIRIAKEMLITAQLEADAELNAKYEGTGL